MKTKIIEDGKLLPFYGNVEAALSCGRIERIKRNNKYNHIDTETKRLISPIWWNLAEEFMEGFAVVVLIDGGADRKHSYNFIDIDGKLLSDTWWDSACTFRNGRGLVKNNEDKDWYEIDSFGNIQLINEPK